MSLWNPVCSVLLCFSVRKKTLENCRGEFFLSQRTFFLSQSAQSSRRFLAHISSHRTPSAYRVHRALLLKVAVRFCEIGWLNVSVGLCVFCSSVFFCEKENTPSMWERTLEIRWGVFSLTERTEFTEPFCAHFELTEASGIQSSQSVTAKDGCKVLCYRLT